ncbi:MAG: TlpA family protein disulfide reductase, partial [Weeksellaceae bacterium]|nr:TlpA family protein disulfide reductase [Weeksellaceae bacterium]
KYFILPLAFIGVNTFAQFNINGQIGNYGNKPILIKIFENGSPKTINTVKTDNNGNFTTKVPVRYNGIVKLETPSGGAISILSDNENIKFTTVYGEQIQTGLKVSEGKAQSEYIKLQQLVPLNELNASIFPHIKNIYSPSDEFYKALEKEEKRINDLNKNQSISSPLVNYISGLEALVKESKTSLSESSANKILSHIEKDDDRLENSSYLPELAFAYINYQFTKSPNDTPENNLQKATEVLLENGNIETERGQNILSTIFTLVPEANFPNFYNNYKKKVNSLTCKVTDDLKKKVNGSSALKIGDKAPDIKFENSVKGKKSLYDIKASEKLVVFWASWCPACNKELPYIKEYYTEFKKKGGEIIAISLDYDQSEFEKATKDLEWFNYTDLLRWDSPIAELYNVDSTPTIFLLDKDNKIVQKVGHITDLQTLK